VQLYQSPVLLTPAPANALVPPASASSAAPRVIDKSKDKDARDADEDAKEPSKEGSAGPSAQTMVYDEEEEEEDKVQTPT